MTAYGAKLIRRRRRVTVYSVPADTAPIAEGGRYNERKLVRVVRFPVVRGMIAPGIVRMVIADHLTEGR